MFMFARCSAFALVALALSGWAAQAQVAPVPYANSNWFLGLGNSGLDGSDDPSRNGMPTGWFMASKSSSFNVSGFNRLGAFGGYNTLSSDGVQFGYALKNTPLSIYAGFDTLKYNAPTSAATHGAFAAFDSKSATASGAFSANAGIEYRPTSNLSLSLGVGVTQYGSQGMVDSDINSPLLPGQTPLAIGGGRIR
jgi:opacity protein-like surface antigen